MAVLGLCIQAFWSGRSLWRIVFVAVAAAISGLGHVAIWDGWLGTEEIRVASTRKWSCSQMYDGTNICIPPERAEDLSQLILDLQPLHEKLLELDPSLRLRTWRAIEEVPGNSLIYELPLGRSLPPRDHAFAVASGLFEECMIKAEEDGDDFLLADKQEIVMLWIDPTTPSKAIGPSGVEWDLSLEIVREAYAASQGC